MANYTQYYVNSAWASLDPGDPVKINGKWHDIGDDAFATVSEAAVAAAYPDELVTINVYDSSTSTYVPTVSNQTVYADASWTAASTDLPANAYFGFNAFDSFNDAYTCTVDGGAIVVSGDTALAGTTLASIDKALAISGSGAITLGTVTVTKAMTINNVNLAATSLTNNSTITASGTATFDIGTLTGNGIRFADGVTVKDSVIGGTLQNIILGEVTFDGDSTISGLAPGPYGTEIVVGAGDSLAVTGARLAFGYDMTFSVTGEIENALTADKTQVKRSLDYQPGFSITGDGESTFTVKDAYVKLGSTSTKEGAASGTYNLEFTNAIVDFTNQLCFTTPKNNLTPTATTTFDGSVVTIASHLKNDFAGSTITLQNGTVLTISGSIQNYLGTIEVESGSSLIDNGYTNSSHGGNTGTVTVSGKGSTFTITNTKNADQWQNSGTVSVLAGGALDVAYITNTGTIALDGASTLTGTQLTNTNGTITIDAADLAANTTKKVIDLSQTAELANVELTAESIAKGVRLVKGADGDVLVTNVSVDNVYVNDEWENTAVGTEVTLKDGTSKATYGINAFDNFKSALAVAQGKGAGSSTTISFDDMAYTYAAPLNTDANMASITTPGTYTLTDGNGALLNYEVEINSDKAYVNDHKKNYVFNIDGAFITLTKLTARVDTSVTIKDSRVDFNQFQGGSAYLSLYNGSTLTISNSTVGFDPHQSRAATPADLPPAGTGSGAYYNWAPRVVVYGTTRITDSTMFIYVGQGNQTGFDVLGNSDTEVKSSTVSLAQLNVGNTSSELSANRLAPGESMDDLSASLVIDGSTFKNTQYRGDYITKNGIIVGSATNTAVKGTMTVKNNSLVDFTVLTYGDAREVGLQVNNSGSSVVITSGSTVKVPKITNAGTITISDSTLSLTGAITNTGTINVYGTSKISAGGYSGSGSLVFGKIGTTTEITTDGLNASSGNALIADGASVTLKGNGFDLNYIQDSAEQKNSEGGHTGYTLTIKDADVFTAYALYPNGNSVIDVNNVKNLNTVYFNVYGGTLNLNGTSKTVNTAGWEDHPSGSVTANVAGLMNVDKTTLKAAIINVMAAPEGKLGGTLNATSAKLHARYNFVGTDAEVGSDAKYTTGTNQSALLKLDASEMELSNADSESGYAFLQIGGDNYYGTVTMENNSTLVQMIPHPATMYEAYRSARVMIGAKGTLSIESNSSVTVDIIENAGTITIDGTGSINSAVSVTNTGNINITVGGTITAETFTNGGTITIDATDLAEDSTVKVIDITGNSGFAPNNIAVIGDGARYFQNDEGDVFVTNISVDNVYISSDWMNVSDGTAVPLPASGVEPYAVKGVDAFGNIDGAINANLTAGMSIYFLTDSTSTERILGALNGASLLRKNDPGVAEDVRVAIGTDAKTSIVEGDFTVGAGVTLAATKLLHSIDEEEGTGIFTVNGTFEAVDHAYLSDTGVMNIATTGKLTGVDVLVSDGYTLNVIGNGEATQVDVDTLRIANATLNVENAIIDSAVTNDGTINVKTAATITSIENNGIINVQTDEATITGAVTNTGDIEAQMKSLNIIGSLTNSGTLTAKQIDVNGGNITNSGTINISGTSEKPGTISAATIANASGTINLGSGATLDAASVSNAGTINVANSTLEAASVTGNGTIVVTGTGDLDVGSISGGKILFGTADAAVAATFDMSKISEQYKVATEALNGTLGLTGVMAEGNVFGKFDLGKSADVATTVTVENGAVLRVQQIEIGKNGNTTAQTFNLNGTMFVDGAFYAKSNSVVNINGNLTLIDGKHMQVAGTTTISGENVVAVIPGSAGNGMLAIGTDEGELRGVLTIENKATVTGTYDVGVGKGTTHRGDLIVQSGATLTTAGAVKSVAGSTITVNGAFLNAGSVENAGTVNVLNGSTLTVTGTIGIGLAAGTGALNVSFGVANDDLTGKVTADAITIGSNGTLNLSIDSAVSTLTEDTYKLVDVTGDAALSTANITVNGTKWADAEKTYGDYTLTLFDNDIVLTKINPDMTTLYVNADWTGDIGTKVGEGMYLGFNAFNDLIDAFDSIEKDVTTTIELSSDVTLSAGYYYQAKNNIAIVGKDNASYEINHPAGETPSFYAQGNSSKTLTINGEITTRIGGQFMAWGSNLSLYCLTASDQLWALDTVTINASAKVFVNDQLTIRGGYLQIDGNVVDAKALVDTPTASLDYDLKWGWGQVGWTGGSASETGKWNLMTLNDAIITGSQLLVGSNSKNSSGIITADNSVLNFTNYLTLERNGSRVSLTDSVLRVTNALTVGANTSVVADDSIVKANTLSNNGSIEMDYTSKITANSFIGAEGSTITVDMTGAATKAGAYQLIDATAASTYGNYSFAAGKDLGYTLTVQDNDLWAIKADKKTILVNAAYSTLSYGAAIEGKDGYFYGINAFGKFTDALGSIVDETETIELGSSITENDVVAPAVYFNHDVAITKSASLTDDVSVTLNVTQNSSTAPDTDGKIYFMKDTTVESAKLTISEGVTLTVPEKAGAEYGAATYFGYNTGNGMTVEIDGKVNAYVFYNALGTDLTVTSTGSVSSTESFIVCRTATVTFNGDSQFTEAKPQADLAYASQQGGIVNLNNTVIDAGAYWEMWNRNSVDPATVKLNMDKSTMIAGAFKGDGANKPDQGFFVTLTDSTLKVTGDISNVGTFLMTSSTATGASLTQNKNAAATFTISDSTLSLTGAITNTGLISVSASTLSATTVTTTDGTFTVSGDSLLTIGTLTGTITVNADANLTGSVVGGGDGVIAVSNAATLTLDGTTDVTSFGAIMNAGTIDIDGASVNLGAITNNGTINIDGDLVNLGAINNAADINMTWQDLLTFSGYEGAGLINIDMTDYNGVEVDTKVLDCKGEAAMDYQAMTGFGTDDFERYFSVKDNDLYLKGGVSDTVYVHDGMSIADAVEMAIEKSAIRIVVENGTFSDSADFGPVLGKNDKFSGYIVEINDGTFDDSATRITGGAVATLDSKKTYLTTEGDRSVTINGGEFNGVVVGGDRLTSLGHLLHGDEEEGSGPYSLNLEINGGKFNKNVAGGMMLDLKATTGEVIQYGDINLTIKGGTFAKFIYGGNVSSSKTYSSQTLVNGDITVTIDTTAGETIRINSLYAGSYGDGRVDGSTKVVLTGDGQYLSVADQLWGGCTGDVYLVSETGTKTAESKVFRTRTLSFEGFTGDLNVKSIKMFSDVKFDAESDVDFTNFRGTMAEVNNWEIAFGSENTGAFNNDFAGDSLTLTGLSGALEEPWVIFGNTSMFKNITEEGAGFAKINGSDAVLSDNLLEGEICGYDLGSYTLAFTEASDTTSAQMVLRNAIA